jgi:hypothetical protein
MASGKLSFSISRLLLLPSSTFHTYSRHMHNRQEGQVSAYSKEDSS